MIFIASLLVLYVNAKEDRGARPDDQQFNLLCKLHSDDADYFTEVDAFATLGNIIASIAQPHENISKCFENEVNINNPMENTILVILTSVILFVSLINTFLNLMLYIRSMISPSLYVRANDREQFEPCQQSTQL